MNYFFNDSIFFLILLNLLEKKLYFGTYLNVNKGVNTLLLIESNETNIK